MVLIGPFTQLLTMDDLPPKGPISDQQLQIIPNAGIVVDNGLITEINSYNTLKDKHADKHFIDSPSVALPGFIDSHTHICYAGSRANEYAQKVSGSTYQEIAANGGGILSTVKDTRKATKKELVDLTLQRLQWLRKLGITTCEIKSGYGLTTLDEIKMLEAIQECAYKQDVQIISTCLAAHTKPPEFETNNEYLNVLIKELFPLLKKHKVTNRIDIFVDKGAFTVDEAKSYLLEAKKQGFQICIHADQFTRGGSELAAELRALSADHLEQSTKDDFEKMANANVTPIALPGASLGLGMPFPKARQMLDSGLALVIASDWNPGSAPMGNLLTEAALLGAAQKLSLAETFAAITVRAANALSLDNCGVLKKGKRADLVVFECSNYQEILYRQGSLLPSKIYTF